MTLKTAKSLMPAGMSLRKTPDGEYRVAFAGRDQEASAYYTNDAHDAVLTARAMNAQRDEQARVASLRAEIEAVCGDPDATPKTSVTVNNVLARLGVAERLVRGNGYWYFIEGASSSWFSSSVPVYRITDLSLLRWVQEHRDLAARTR